MLKPFLPHLSVFAVLQPPSGGCVLKLDVFLTCFLINLQPPSGGCVLKPPMTKTEESELLGSRLRAAVC